MKIKRSENEAQLLATIPSAWFSTSELLEYLGISQSELDEKAENLTEGVHFRLEDPKVKDSQILWRVDLIDEVLCLPIAPLEKEVLLNAINNHITCNKQGSMPA